MEACKHQIAPPVDGALVLALLLSHLLRLSGTSWVMVVVCHVFIRETWHVKYALLVQLLVRAKGALSDMRVDFALIVVSRYSVKHFLHHRAL